MTCSTFLGIGLVLGAARTGLAQQPCVQDASKARLIVVGPGGGGIIGLPTDNHPGRTPPPPPCKAPDYVGQASKDLLAGIKLTKAQSDSAKTLERAAKQSMDTAMATVQRARGESGGKVGFPVETAAVAGLPLPLRSIIDEYLADLRALMTPDQLPAFDANAAGRGGA